MGKTTATSRGGSHTRPKNPQHPVAKYCRLARDRMGLTLEGLADKLHVTKSSVQQWEQGQTYPRADALLRISVLSKVSLAAITAYAEAMRRGHVEPSIGEFDARLSALPAFLKDDVVAQLVKNETIAQQLPDRDDWQTAAD